MSETFIEFYQGLFTSINPILNEEALNPVPKLLTKETNQILPQDFMEWEVQTELKQMCH